MARKVGNILSEKNGANFLIDKNLSQIARTISPEYSDCF